MIRGIHTHTTCLGGGFPNHHHIIFQAATIDNIRYFLKRYLKCSPANIILHVCPNNCINYLSVILNTLQNEFPESTVTFLLNRSDNGIARLKASDFFTLVNTLKMDTVNKSIISLENLISSNLLLNGYWKGEVTMNLRIK